MNDMNAGRDIQLSEKKEIMLEMLKQFFAYCEANQLRCYLAGGTLLGAVRHKGYIPWDDDIDLMMPLDDYKKLMDLSIDKPIGENIFLSSTKSNSNHMWPMLKVIDMRTSLVDKGTVRATFEKKQASFYGVYLDVFPMYGLPIEFNQRMRCQKKINRIYSGLKKSVRIMTKRPQDSNSVFYFRRCVYDIVCIPYRFLGYKFFLNKMDEIIQMYNIKDSEYFGFSCGITRGTKDHFRTALISDTELLPFENLKCPVFSGYDEMLKNQFGDYMQLPPKDQRRWHPTNTKWRE